MSRLERFSQSREEQLERQPETMEEILVGKELSPEELRASQAADVMNVPLSQKRILFGAYLFMGKQGFFRTRDLLGTTNIQAVSMRDRVVTDPKYERTWETFKLLQEPNYLEVAKAKKARITHNQLAINLGLSMWEIIKMTRELRAREVIEVGERVQWRAREYGILLGEISRLISSGTTDFDQIAGKLTISRQRVLRAVNRLIKEGREDLVPIKDGNISREKYTKEYVVFEGHRKGSSLTNREIAAEMGKSEDWAEQSAKALIKRRRIKSRRPVVNRNLLKRKILEVAVEYEKEKPGKNIPMRYLRRKLGIGGDRSIKSAYEELMETFPIPSLMPTRRRHNREEIEREILRLVEGRDPNGGDINLREIYEKGDFECSKGTVYNVYHDMSERMMLPPLIHGGRSRR